MQVKVSLNPTSVIKARIFGGDKAQKYFTNACHRYMDKYVPYRDGPLRNNVTIGDDFVRYNSLYAHYQYVGELYVDPETGSSYARKNVAKVPTGKNLKYHTAGTGSRWDRKMWSAEGQNVVEEVQQYIDRGCK
jgi:hypothetical protein